MIKQKKGEDMISKIEILNTHYNQMKANYERACESTRKSYDAGVEMFETFRIHFEKLTKAYHYSQRSFDVYKELINLIKDESNIEIIQEMCANIYDDLSFKIKNKLRRLTKGLEEEMNNISFSNDKDETISTRRHSTRLCNKRNIPPKKEPSPEVIQEDVLQKDLSGVEVSIQNVILNPYFQEKLDSLIAPELECIGSVALDTDKVIKKVKEICAMIGISTRIIGPVVAKLSIGAFNDLLNRVRPWETLKTRMQDVIKRLYSWIINKDAILFIQSICPRKVTYFKDDKIILPKPSYFWLNYKDDTPNEIGQIISLPIFQENVEPEVFDNSEFRPNVRINKYVRSVDISIINQDIFERTGKTYEFKNKCIEMSEIKNMTNREFRFFGFLNTVELCKEIRKHLSDTNFSQKDFADHILGMSQGSASDLLTKPKEWRGLTRRGRDPYIKMRAYLDLYEIIKDELKTIIEIEEQKQLDLLKTMHKKPSEEESELTPKEEVLDYNNVKGCSRFVEKRKIISKNTPSSPITNNFTPPNLSRDIKVKRFTIATLNTMALATEIKTLLDDCKITPALFAEKFMEMKAQDFHRVISFPRAWNLSPESDKQAYKKIKNFLDNTELVNKLKEGGLDALQIKVKVTPPSQEQPPKNVIILSNYKKPINMNLTPLPKLPTLKRPGTTLITEIDMKKNRLSIGLPQNNVKTINVVNRASGTLDKIQIKNECVEKEIKEEVNSISIENNGINKNLIDKVSTNSHLTNKNYGISVDNGETEPMPQLVEENIIINTESNKPMNRVINTIKLHKSNFITIFDKKQVICFEVPLSVRKANCGKEAFLNPLKLELLHLAWTFDSNPTIQIKNYLCQMIGLSKELLEIWYYEMNKLTPEYFKYEETEKVYKKRMREDILRFTKRKQYLAVTNVVFKQLFTNEFDSLIQI
uniref:CUT domain-containing protein n=1 Tax=Parastrongyloides trichosuri TaxID=131310 RepID=A0A0N4ZCT5_PARTI